MDFDKAANFVLANEGGLVDNQNDPGGITNHGISLRFLKCIEDPKKYGIFSNPVTADDIRNLSVDQAKHILHDEFWVHAPFYQITNQEICNYIFDMAINMGIAPAIKCVQRAIWACLRDRNILQDDGILGNNTLLYIDRCSLYLSYALRSERAGFYRLCAINHPEFLEGWLNRAYES